MSDLETPDTKTHEAAPPRGPLRIPADLLQAMVDHCLREDPLECCGILGGTARNADSLFPLRNADASETRYSADPRDLIAAYQALRAREAEIVAIYHSHPRWAPIPSRTDLRENYYGPVPRIIIGLLASPPEVRAWRLEPESYHEIAIQVVSPSGNTQMMDGCSREHPSG